MHRRGLCFTTLALVICGVSACATAQTGTDPFDSCEMSLKAEPRGRESPRCFYEVARRNNLMDEAVRRLDSLRLAHPENPWLPFYLGHILLIRRSDRVEEVYRDAMAVSDRHGVVECQVEARLWLTRHLADLDRLEEGDELLAQAARLAEESGDRLLLAEVGIRQAWQYKYHGRDLDYAYDLLRQIEPDVFPNGPARLRSGWLRAMPAVSILLGRNDEALRAYEGALAMALEEGDPTSEAQARFTIAIHHITAELPSPYAREKALDLFEAALATAEAAGHRSVEVQTHFELGRLLGGAEGRRHLETCLEIAAELKESGRGFLSKCQGALAAHLTDVDPRRAEELMDRALATADDLWATVYMSAEHLQVRWATRPRFEAIADSLEVLETLETLRELQGSDSGRARVMSLLSEVYYGLSGRLLLGTDKPIAGRQDYGPQGRRDDLELAFTVTERMRARVLLESLATARVASASPPADLADQLSAVLERKVQLNRSLLRPELESSAREENIVELEAAEAEESELRHRMIRASPAYGAVGSTAVATLAEVERSLDEDEALLSYQVGLDEDYFSGWFAGGSWLLVSTRRGTRSYRLPDRVSLEPALEMLLGRRDLDVGLERLYHDLLGRALEELPDDVERLVIIPDGKLHRLPFALLRPEEDSAPVITRYQLSVAPSATLWLRWRRLETPSSEVAALALADPQLAGSEATPTAAATDRVAQRQWALKHGARLEPLPYARQEAQTVVRILGGQSRLLLGEDATERFLKENDLRRYGVLHFAAHAVIDDEVPERSAILLAPGADDEDGWLQPQDIVGLDLDGRVVVLASCESATGHVLRGEGPMSLARSFFHAGAPVVVASLWPVPDDETARLFKTFYESLASGKSVAGALAVAQRKMLRRGILRRGAPARAWAGLVALGNGDLVPFPGGLERPGPPAWVYVVLAALALAAAVLVTRARGGGRRTPSSSRRGGAEPSP